MSTQRSDSFPQLTGLTESLKLAANNTPEKSATVMGNRNYSWSALRDRVSCLAGGLQSKGVTDGDRVAILSLNSDYYSLALYAVWWSGACVVPVNTRWAPAEIEYCLKDSSTSVIFVDKTFYDVAKAITEKVDSIKAIILLEDSSSDSADIESVEQVIDNASAVGDAQRKDDDLAGIYYTGGTTGAPKGVMLTHASQCHTGKALAIEMKFTNDSIYLHAAPMFHAADFASGCAAALAGATNAYLPAFTPAGLQTVIFEQQITHSLLVPTMIGMLVSFPDFAAEKLSTLEFLLYGGSSMPTGILQAVVSKLPHVSIAQGYGQTESVPITILPPDYHVLEGHKSTKITSAGRAAYGCEIAIKNPDTNESLPVGAVGEIAVKSPNNMVGYWKLDDVTAKTLSNGWVSTGDGGYIDNEGFVFIVDRLKDMIVSGGENVYSAEVENAISTFPGVAEVAVIGIPSEKWGETVHAIIVPKAAESIDEEALLSHCRELIAGYKLPRSIEIRSESLPLSGAGKILKRELRKQ